MTNVLPHDARRALSASLRSRMILVGSLVFTVAAGVSALAVLPTYLVIEADRAALPPSSLDTATPEDREVRSEAARVRALLSGITPLLSATSTVHGYVASVLAVKPTGISIDRIGYAQTGVLSLSGTASKREDVNAYRAALSADTARFAQVSVPAASLIGLGGGRFSIDITLAQ